MRGRGVQRTGIRGKQLRMQSNAESICRDMHNKDKEKRSYNSKGLKLFIVAAALSVLALYVNVPFLTDTPLIGKVVTVLRSVQALIVILAEGVLVLAVQLFYYFKYYEKLLTPGKDGSLDTFMKRLKYYLSALAVEILVSRLIVAVFAPKAFIVFLIANSIISFIEFFQFVPYGKLL